MKAMQEGARLLQAGDARRALPLLHRAYRLCPKDAEAAVNLGGAYIMLRRFPQAVAVLEPAAEANPNHVMIWINLGAAYLGVLDRSTDEQQSAAIAAFERALALDPAAPSVNYNIGLIRQAQGDLESARAQYSRAAAVNPYDRDARRLLARTQLLLDGPSLTPAPPNGGPP